MISKKLRALDVHELSLNFNPSSHNGDKRKTSQQCALMWACTIWTYLNLRVSILCDQHVSISVWFACLILVAYSRPGSDLWISQDDWVLKTEGDARKHQCSGEVAGQRSPKSGGRSTSCSTLESNSMSAHSMFTVVHSTGSMPLFQPRSNNGALGLHRRWSKSSWMGWCWPKHSRCCWWIACRTGHRFDTKCFSETLCCVWKNQDTIYCFCSNKSSCQIQIWGLRSGHGLAPRCNCISWRRTRKPRCITTWVFSWLMIRRSWTRLCPTWQAISWQTGGTQAWMLVPPDVRDPALKYHCQPWKCSPFPTMQPRTSFLLQVVYCKVHDMEFPFILSAAFADLVTIWYPYDRIIAHSCNIVSISIYIYINVCVYIYIYLQCM